MCMEELKKCIYCDKEKSIKEFSSLEHIFPDALGGNLCNDTFKTRDVCNRCNSICGIWVDAPVIKNWFTAQYKFDIAREFVDLKNGSVLPLIYMGIFEELCDTEKICEVWLDPCGGSIYHFRNHHDRRFDSIIGGDFIDLRKNPGTVYLFVATDNQDWIKTVLLSFREHFKYSKKIACNISVTGDLFQEPDENEKAIIEKLKSFRGKYHKVKFSVENGFEQRFLCKLALGVGFNLFGESYLQTDYAKEIRRGLWEKDSELRKTLQIPWTLFDDKANLFKELLCYKGAHLISIREVDKYLSLGFCLFGKIFTQIAISDDNKFWQNHKEYSSGIVYLIFPQIKEFVGPISLPLYLAHKSSEDYRIEKLLQIENKRVDLNKLPPFQSDKYNSEK